MQHFGSILVDLTSQVVNTAKEVLVEAEGLVLNDHHVLIDVIKKNVPDVEKFPLTLEALDKFASEPTQKNFLVVATKLVSESLGMASSKLEEVQKDEIK